MAFLDPDTDGRVVLVDARSGTYHVIAAGRGVEQVALSPDGGHLALRGDDLVDPADPVDVVDLRTGTRQDDVSSIRGWIAIDREGAVHAVPRPGGSEPRVLGASADGGTVTLSSTTGPHSLELDGRSVGDVDERRPAPSPPVAEV